MSSRTDRAELRVPLPRLTDCHRQCRSCWAPASRRARNRFESCSAEASAQAPRRPSAPAPASPRDARARRPAAEAPPRRRVAAGRCGPGGRSKPASNTRPPVVATASVRPAAATSRSPSGRSSRGQRLLQRPVDLIGDFTQIGGDGRKLTGKLYLPAPGQAPLRIRRAGDAGGHRRRHVGGRARQQARDPGPLSDLADAAEVPAQRPHRPRPGHAGLGRRPTSAMASASSSRTDRRSAAPRRSRSSSIRP